MRKLGLLDGAALVALLSVFGCSGKAQSGAKGAADSGGNAGPLATCGDTCTAAEITASCMMTCDKIARSACSSGNGNDCPMSCPALVSMSPSCMSVATDFLRCIEPVDPTCAEAGIAQYSGCDAQQQALTDCLNGGLSPVPTPGSSSGSTVPSSVCPSIPRPAAGGAGACSGGGGAGGSGGPQTCTTSCQDMTGNTWQANCSGSTCTCTYNGGMACTCAMASSGGCSSCCPGTG